MSFEFKNTIEILCKLIHLLYDTDLKPEHFRLAKHNKNDKNVVPILWNVVTKLLNEDNSELITRQLHDLNYKKSKSLLYTEANCKSRELLLVIGFLLTIYLEKAVQGELHNSVLSGNCESFQKYQLHDTKKESEEKFDWNKLNKNDLENYKKWMYGKILLNRNLTEEYTQEIVKLQQKFSKTLDIKANGILTVYEILALKDPVVGEQFLQETESILNILTIYSEWLKKEKYFWKWMGSVVIEENKNKEKQLK